MTKSRLRFLPPRVPTFDSRKVKPEPRKAVAFAAPLYQTPEWKALRRDVLRERGHRCERCGRTDGRIDLHHKVEVKDGGSPLDPRNVELICREEHLQLTKNARAVREGRLVPHPVIGPSATRPAEPEKPKPDPNKQRFIIA